MAKHPMSKTEAENFCHAFQYLVNSKFSADPDTIQRIECVAVSPFDDVNKYIFIKQYNGCHQAEEALEIYGGQLFDVVIITRVISQNVEFIYKSLDEYLNEMGIAVDMQKYLSGQK
jgi:hypothetical protein